MRYVISRRGPADRCSADNRIQSTREDDVVSNPDWLWPNGKRIAVVFNVCLEAWSDGKAPGISPMGNPLPAGVLDTMAISWAAYDRAYKALIRSARLVDVTASFAMEELKHSTAVPLPSKM